MHLILLVARCHLKQSYDHPSICITKFSYTYPSSHDSQVFNLLYCSHRPLDSLDMRTGVMWRMCCVYKDWCEDCNELRKGALLRCCGGAALPRKIYFTKACFCLVRVSLDKTEKFRSCGSPAKVVSLFCSFACSSRSCFSKLGQPKITVGLTICRTLLKRPTSE